MSAPIAVAPVIKGENAFVRAVEALTTFFGWIAAALTVVALIVTCQMIFVRSFLGQSTIWQTEAVIYLMIAATTLGLGYVQQMRGHVNVDLIPMALGPRARRVLAYAVLLATIGVSSLIAFYSWDLWHQAFERNWKSSTVWAPPLWVPYLAMPLGFGLFLLQLVADLVKLATGTEPPFGIKEV
ncbi:TRAP transporter small permease subunit [Paracoccus aestuariivivens]|uniref:TRAP transporter small permease protein n=1 Tax=Paracoccus aestuariivivens TaxID=1820333 RepID=A0A6L6JGS5_9RHOB|nr:TRAP transporter small permease [Paracoccus aestuariivivens]MTH79899.1 TRAP transporter small permease subunit [Paracoccus aestuariivivens]